MKIYNNSQNQLSDFRTARICCFLIIAASTISVAACHGYGYRNHVDEVNKTYAFDCSEDTLAKRIYELENRAGSLFLEQLYIADSSEKYYAHKYDESDDSVSPAHLWHPEIRVIDPDFGHNGRYDARIKISANGNGCNLILEKFEYGGGERIADDRQILIEAFEKNIVGKIKCP